MKDVDSHGEKLLAAILAKTRSRMSIRDMRSCECACARVRGVCVQACCVCMLVGSSTNWHSRLGVRLLCVNVEFGFFHYLYYYVLPTRGPQFVASFSLYLVFYFFIYITVLPACWAGGDVAGWLAGRSCAFRLVDGATCGVVTSTTFWLSVCAACLVLALPVLRACPCCCFAELVPSQSLVPSHVLVHLQNPRADIFICRKS